jgi:hypothetical protein
LPTLVPPYFWTSHGVVGSVLFLYDAGGVRRPAPTDDADDTEGDRDDFWEEEEVDMVGGEGWNG